MRRKSGIGLVAAFAVVSGALFGAEKPATAAETAARTWLGLTDGGKYGESWDAASTLFREAITRTKWEEALREVRAPLGKVVTRKLASAQHETSLPGAPPGEYVRVVYDTEFQNRPGSTETATFTKDKDGTWRAAGYYIK